MQRDRMKLSFLRQINACICLDRYEGGYCAKVSVCKINSLNSTLIKRNAMKYFIPCMNQVLFIFFIQKQESKFDRRLYLIIQVLLSTTMDNRSSRKRLLENESEYFSR
ncbi:hypothetical protein CLI73_08540 [Porphyromonas gingivalis]|nr:hypothetical protein CLI73_08540 [Porphyromonas gingivalis]